jgi:hypothetical protein
MKVMQIHCGNIAILGLLFVAVGSVRGHLELFKIASRKVKGEEEYALKIRRTFATPTLRNSAYF